MSRHSEELAHLHGSLAAHVRKGQPLGPTLWMLADELEDRRLAEAVGDMVREIEKGADVASAWKAAAPVIPSYYADLLGEAAAHGDLADALEQVAAHAQRTTDLHGRLRRALAGPALTAIICLLLGVAAAWIAGPQLDLLSRKTFGGSISPMMWIGAGIVVVFVTIAVLATRWRAPLARGRFGWPVIGKLRLAAARADVASGLALLLQRGMALPRAVGLLASRMKGSSVKAALDRMQSEAEHGASVGETLRAGALFSGSELWLVDMAEGSARTPQGLVDLAEVHRRRLDRGLDRMSVVARPVAELVVGVAVFFFAYSYAAPALDFLSWFQGH